MSLALFEPYVDGHLDLIGKELTVIPRVRFPFGKSPTPDTYSREYERDFEIFPGSQPRIDVRTAWTNLLTYSEDIDNAAWTKTNLSVTANSVTAPDGRVTMDKLLETTTNAEHSVAQAATVTAAAWEVSFFIKGGLTREWARAAFTDSAATVFSAFFSTNGYAVSASAGTTVGIVALGNGHFYCWLRFTPASGAGTFKTNLSTDGSTISYAGTTSAGIYLWGAQVALGSLAPYISTTAAARSILAPDRDPRDPFAYLLMETDPEPVNSARARLMRTFGRVPLTQTIPGSIWVTKPELTGTFPQVINGSLVTQPDPTKEEYAFSSQVAVASDSGAASSLTTGGTYTVTFGANTTAGVAFNASAATLESALDGLASVIAYGGVTVTGSHTAGFNVAFNYAAVTAGTGSLTVTNGTVNTTVLQASQGLVQTVLITPSWNSANGSGASSFTPASANPMTTGNSIGAAAGGISFFMGNTSASAAVTGFFTLTAFGDTTNPIAYNASTGTMQTELNALAGVTARGGYTVTSIGSSNGVPGFGAALPTIAISGGNYTLTVLGQVTGSINHNASLATIQTAINALSNVTARGGVIVSGDGFASGKISITITFANIPAFTGSAASLTPSGTISILPATSQGINQAISFSTNIASSRVVTTTAVHGISASDDVYANSTFVDSTGFTVIDTRTIAFNSASGLLFSATPITFIGRVVGVNYVAGPKETRCDFVTDYYFPGVTAGISTAVDIPIPDYHGDDEALIDAIFAGSTEININTGQLAQYSDTPILARTITKINAALL